MKYIVLIEFSDDFESTKLHNIDEDSHNTDHFIYRLMGLTLVNPYNSPARGFLPIIVPHNELPNGNPDRCSTKQLFGTLRK